MAERAFKPRKNCKICQAVKSDKRLFKRIYASKYYHKGGEPLLAIATEEGLNYRALTTHCKKHQNLSEDALAAAQLNEIAKSESREIARKFVRAGDARQDMIDKLQHQLDQADMSELTAKDVIALLAKVTRDSDDVAAKAKDQNIDIMRMMGAVRSGEVSTSEVFEEFDPWKEQAIEGELVEPEL